MAGKNSTVTVAGKLSQVVTDSLQGDGKGSQPNKLTFESLVESIRQMHEQMAARAGRAVNICLTLRNWAIGYHIHEYEQNGRDRAKYGAGLLESLSKELAARNLTRVGERELRRFRQFYQAYPQIREAVTPEFPLSLPTEIPMAEKRESATPELRTAGIVLVKNLSFTHLDELSQIDDPTKRLFYETQCISGNWSVRELKRQISSLYYERSGLSKNKMKLAEMVRTSAQTAEPALAIRDPYIFEFLGLKPAEVMSESAFEDRLLDNLQDFLLELGEGFCFEARQKRILIGESHYFIDLVFYHRILKCHVLVELKLADFSHENIGQLNTYVSWYRQNMVSEGDNPPVGILLCARNDRALAEYALAGMDNKLFVSKYKLELPGKKDMERFIEDQMKEAKIGEL
jgi:predicted nuclease of restriction endonuclease-like (RecB) superfamily